MKITSDGKIAATLVERCDDSHTAVTDMTPIPPAARSSNPVVGYTGGTEVAKPGPILCRARPKARRVEVVGNPKAVVEEKIVQTTTAATVPKPTIAVQ